MVAATSVDAYPLLAFSDLTLHLEDRCFHYSLGSTLLPDSKVTELGSSDQKASPSENTGLVSSGVSLTSWGEGASLALVGHPSSDGVTIKMPYGVDVLHRAASHPIFSYWVG